jgi:CO/xanthine dehydrogenase FAD-binding subunit
VATKVYFQPQSLDEALCLADEHRQALVIAGGTLALPLINKGVSKPEKVLGLRRAGLSYVRDVRTANGVNGAVHIGATTTLTQLRSSVGISMVADAVKNIGGWAVQNMGTTGGNLFAPPPAGDLAVALLALDAQVKLASRKGGERLVPLSEFFTGFMMSCMEPGELVVELQVPKPAGKTALLKLGRLFTNTPSVVAVAVHVTEENGKVRDARIAMNAVGPHPILARNAQAALKGAALTEASIAAAAAAAAAECEPFTDPIASEWYRRKMAGVYAQRALSQVAGLEV